MLPLFRKFQATISTDLGQNHMIKTQYKSVALIAFIFGYSQWLNAQVPNGGFENWSTQSKEVPENWTLDGDFSKVAGKTGTALRFKNMQSQSVSYALQANFDTSAFFTSAFSYSATPDSFTVDYNPALAGDTASVQVGFFKAGELIAIGAAELFGNSATWMSGTFPVNYISGTPSLIADSAYVWLASGDAVFGPYASGQIDIDAITFKYKDNSTAPNIPNYSFENWHGSNVEYPTNWVSSALYYSTEGNLISHTTRSTGGVGGSLACELRGITIQDGETAEIDTLPGILLSKNPAISVSESDIFTPSFPINQRYSSIRASIKSSLEAGDVAVIWVNIWDADSIVGSVEYINGNSLSSLTEISEDITYNPSFTGIPDSATIGLLVSDSSLESVNSLNSYAIFDDIRFDIWSTKIATTPTFKASFYPNPSQGSGYLKLNSNAAGKFNIEVLNASGQVVYVKTGEASAGPQIIATDLSSLTHGAYFMQVTLGNSIYNERIILTP